jgi:hypothetical protein
MFGAEAILHQEQIRPVIAGFGIGVNREQLLKWLFIKKKPLHYPQNVHVYSETALVPRFDRGGLGLLSLEVEPECPDTAYSITLSSWRLKLPRQRSSLRNPGEIIPWTR